MKGLRTQESDKFKTYFSLIQSEAGRQGMVFYADAGDGRDFETEAMEGEDMMGWLIPQEKAGEFEPLWHAWKEDDSWSDYYMWAGWDRCGDSVKIRFED